MSKIRRYSSHHLNWDLTRWYPQLNQSLCQDKSHGVFVFTGTCSQRILCLHTATIPPSNPSSTLSTTHHRGTESTLPNSHLMYTWKGYSTNKVNEEKNNRLPIASLQDPPCLTTRHQYFFSNQYKLELNMWIKRLKCNPIFCLKNPNKPFYAVWDFKQRELPTHGGPHKHRGATIPKVCKSCKCLSHSLAICYLSVPKILGL